VKLRREVERYGYVRTGAARRGPRGLEIRAGAQLFNRPAEAWLGSGRAPQRPNLPAGVDRWRDCDRQRYLDTQALLAAWDEHLCQQPLWDRPLWHRLPAGGGSKVRAAAFALRPAGDFPVLRLLHSSCCTSSTTIAQWAASRGLSCGLSSLYEYRARLRHDGNHDGRGRPRGGTTVDPRLAEHFAARALHENGFQLSVCWRDTRDLAEELELALPALPWWRRWLRETYPHAARVLARSRKRHADVCLPKIERTYTDIAPLEWISLDGHVLNLRCQAEDARKTGKAIRPTLTGVLDIRTRLFVGWDLRPTENSDGILAGLMRMHREYGCARHYYADNGAAYKASLGHRVRPQLFDDPRIGQLCAMTGAERHNAIPYAAWAKMIESHWGGVVQNFEKYFTSWWGNKIETRPDEASKVPVWDLPTLAEVRAAWSEFLVSYHAEPQQGDGMYGLSPQLVYEQFAQEKRVLDADVLRFVCSRTLRGKKGQPGYRIVRRDGVRIDGRIYGQYQEEVHLWQRRKVLVRIDPSDLGYIWLYDEQRRDVLIATNRQLSGATSEDLREAQRFRARLKKLAAEYLPGQDFLLESTPQQIMHKKAERAQARQAVARAALPVASAPAVTIVRPDLVKPVQAALAARARPRLPAGDSSTSVPTALERLSDVGARASEPETRTPLPRRDLRSMEDPHRGESDDEGEHTCWSSFREAAG
jgi:hypothetical protein